MLVTRVMNHEALDKLTTGSGALSVAAAETILGDLLWHAEQYKSEHVLIDFDQIKTAWFEEDIDYVLEAYDAKNLEDLDDQLYMLKPKNLDGKVVYMHLDDDMGIEEL